MMARLIAGLVSNGFRGDSTSQLSGILLLIGMVAAAISVVAVVIFNCGSTNKSRNIRRPRNDVAYYGTAPTYGGTGGGGGGGGRGLAVGAGVGLAAGLAVGVAISAADSGGGDAGGCGGGCGGGGCGGGGCGGGCGG